MVNMTDTVELTFKAPEKMIQAAKHICEAFDYTLDEYLTDSLRGELQCSFHDSFFGVSEYLRDKIAKEVLEILGEEP